MNENIKLYCKVQNAQSVNLQTLFYFQVKHIKSHKMVLDHFFFSFQLLMSFTLVKVKSNEERL